MAKKRNGNPNDPGTFFVNTGNGSFPVGMDSQMHRDLYNSGRLMTYNPQMDEYIAPSLPEFTVSAKRNKSFLEEWGDKMVQESKGVGPAGAIFGATMNAGSSLAQLALTKLLTGKTQRPSEAMNIQNPYGAGAVDMVLDPLNAAGGFTVKGNKLLGMFGKKAASNPAVLTNEIVDIARTKWWNNQPLSVLEESAIQQYGKGSKNNYYYTLRADKNISGEIKGPALQYLDELFDGENVIAKANFSPKKEQELLSKLSSDVSQKQRYDAILALRDQAIKNFKPRRVAENEQIKNLVNEYWNSPELKNKLINQWTKDEYYPMTRGWNHSLSKKKALAKELRNYAVENYNAILDNIKDTDTFVGTNKEALGFYDPSLKSSYLTNSDIFSYLTNNDVFVTKPRRLSTAIHEVGSHAALQSTEMMPYNMQSALSEAFLPTEQLLKISKDASNPLREVAAAEAKRPYLTSPEEIHARILQTRLHSGKFPQGQLTWEDFQNATMAWEKGRLLNPLDPDFTKLILDPQLFVKNANKYAAGLPIVPALNNKNNK